MVHQIRVSKALQVQVFRLICHLLLPLSTTAFLTVNFPSAALDTSPNSYTSYQLGPVCNPTDPIRHPKSTNELMEIVIEAIDKGTTVKAFGHRHSTTDIICTAGIPVDMRGIQGMKMNQDNSVTVGAGVYLIDLCEFLKDNGRSLKTIPGFGLITIGGAIGTGAHGSTTKYHSSISDQVIGLTIIDGRGHLRSISTEEDLRAFRVHLGLLGLIIDVTFETHPLYKVYAHNYVTDDSILFDGKVQQIAKDTDQVSIYWFPMYSKVVIANWTILYDVNTPGEAYTNDHVPPTSASFNFLYRTLNEFGQKKDKIEILDLLQAIAMETLHNQVPDFVPIYTEDGQTLKNPAVGYYHKMFAPTCDDKGDLQCPWFHGPFNLTFLDNEIGIEMGALAEVAKDVKDILDKYPAVFPMQGIILRFSSSSTSYMSESYGRDTCHFEFYMIKRNNPYDDGNNGLASYQAILQTLVKKYNGRSHWGKTGHYYHSRQVLDQRLGPLAKAAFLAKMNEYDPNGVFMNAFGARLKGIGSEINIDPATKHCALLDNCLCSRDEDCAVGETCGRLTGYPEYPVCKSPTLFISVSVTAPIIQPFPSLIKYVKFLFGMEDTE